MVFNKEGESRFMTEEDVDKCH